MLYFTTAMAIPGNQRVNILQDDSILQGHKSGILMINVESDQFPYVIMAVIMHVKDP